MWQIFIQIESNGTNKREISIQHTLLQHGQLLFIYFLRRPNNHIYYTK